MVVAGLEEEAAATAVVEDLVRTVSGWDNGELLVLGVTDVARKVVVAAVVLGDTTPADVGGVLDVDVDCVCDCVCDCEEEGSFFLKKENKLPCFNCLAPGVAVLAAPLVVPVGLPFPTGDLRLVPESVDMVHSKSPSEVLCH